MTGSSKYKAIFLPTEVYRHAAADLADLRLVDSTGRTIPYYIQTGALVRQQSETLQSALLVDSFQGGGDSYFEYSVAAKDNTDPVGNNLKFALPAGNFVKYLEVYGSYDGVEWQYVTKDYLYKVNGQEKSEVSLAARQKYRYYRIRLLDNVEGLSLDGMSLILRQDSSAWSRYEQTTRMDYKIVHQKNQTVITVSNPCKLRLRRLIVETEGNFRRQYEVYRDAKAGYPVEIGEICNLQFSGVNISEKTIRLDSLPVAETLVIKIEDRDDRPLPITGIQADYYVDKLVFADLGNRPYRLYFGNANAGQPSYDLAEQCGYIESEKQDECHLQAVQGRVPAQAAAPLIRSDYLFDGAIAVVSLVLIIILVPKLSSRQ